MDSLNKRKYWIAPVGGTRKVPSRDTIRTLIGQHGIFAISETNFVRLAPRKGDLVCFYARGSGVSAHAEIAADPQKRFDPRIPNSEKYSFVFPIQKHKLYLEDPVVLDEQIRFRLQGLAGRGKDSTWAFFVRNFHELSQPDFQLLTRTRGSRLR